MSELNALRLSIVPVTPYAQNCSVVMCTETSLCAVVDPGGDLARIEQAIERLGAKIDRVLLTHGHWDHCGQARIFADRHGVPLIGPHRDDAFWIDQLPSLNRPGFQPTPAFEPDRWLVEGDQVEMGSLTFEVFHCPGHTPGHVVFYNHANQLAWVGDVLFKGSMGRTDFPRGNHADLIAAITQKLWPLGDDVAFVPGHGPMSTFGDERATNPYVADHVLAVGNS